MKDLAAVGYYGVAYKFSDLAGIAITAVFATALPLMVRAWPEEPRRFHQTVRHAFLLLAVIAVVIGVEFACFGAAAITTFYGHRYRVVAGAAGGLVAGQLVAFFTQFCFMVFVTVGRAWRYVSAALFGLVLNVALNLALIPRWSYNGAAVATVITEVAVLASLFPGTVSVPFVRPLPWRSLGKLVAAAVLPAGLGVACRGVVPWPVGAAVVLLTFAACLHFVRVDGPGGLQALWRPPEMPESDIRTSG